MAIYHFTFHAYRTWRPDNPRGYVRPGMGYLPPDEDMARKYDARAKFDPVEFTDVMQAVLIVGSHDICSRRGWRLYIVATDPTHLHLVIGWIGFVDWVDVRDKLKNLLSLFLGRLANVQSRPWFVEKGSRKRVKNQDHFNYLIETYLPSHRGLVWKQGQKLPEIPAHILDPGGFRPRLRRWRG